MAVEGGDPNDLKAIAAKARSLHPEAYTDGTTANRRTPRNADAQDFQYKKAKHTDPEHWANKTITMHELIEEQGWSGKIRQLDDEQFIEAVKASKYPPIYRGVYEYQGKSSIDLNQAFLSEDIPWVGDGVYGAGWYTSTHLDSARMYARKRSRFGKFLSNEDVPREDIGESVLEMALKPTARVINLEDLIAEGLNPRHIRRASEWAAKRGYDAVELPGAHFITHQEHYYLVINRTALVARKLK